MSKFVACGFVNSILGHSINHSPEWILFGAFGVLWAAIKLGSCAYVQFYDLWFHEFNNQPFNQSFSWVFGSFQSFVSCIFFNCDESSVNVHMSRFVVLWSQCSALLSIILPTEIYTEVHELIDLWCVDQCAELNSIFVALSSVSCLSPDVHFKTLFNKSLMVCGPGNWKDQLIVMLGTSMCDDERFWHFSLNLRA